MPTRNKKTTRRPARKAAPTTRFSVTTTVPVLKKIDAVADTHNRSRSYYVNKALEMWERAGCPA